MVCPVCGVLSIVYSSAEVVESSNVGGQGPADDFQ